MKVGAESVGSKIKDPDRDLETVSEKQRRIRNKKTGDKKENAISLSLFSFLCLTRMKRIIIITSYSVEW